MTEIESPENQSNISSEEQKNESNPEGEVVQNSEQHEFFTQDQAQAQQSGNNNDNNQEEQEKEQKERESNKLDSLIENNLKLLHQNDQKNSTSSSSKPVTPKQSQTSPKQPKEEKKSNQKNNEEQTNYTEEELDEYINAIVDKRTPPPKELRNPILQLLNRRRVQAVVDGDYDYAEEQDNNIKAFNRVIQSQDNKSNENEQFEILFGRYQQLQKDYQEITDRWDEKINKYNEEEEQLYNGLLRKQEEEKEIYHQRWANPKNLRQFTKPSPKLNSMREQERAMAVAKMYQQAKIMKQSADRLQKEETAAAQQRISQTMEIEWSRMLERHENERKKFGDHKNRNIAFLESEKQKELKPTLNALNQIKSKRGLLLSTKQSSMTITKSAQEIEAQSPRTHKKFSDFKAEKKKPKLDVQPVTDQQLQSTKKSTRSQSRLSKTQSQSSRQSEKQQQQEKPNENSQNENENQLNNENQQNENQSNNENSQTNVNEDQQIEKPQNSEKEDESSKEINDDKNNENQQNENQENKEKIENSDNLNETDKSEGNEKDENKQEQNNPPDLFSKITDVVESITEQQENKDQTEKKNDEKVESENAENSSEKVENETNAKPESPK